MAPETRRLSRADSLILAPKSKKSHNTISAHGYAAFIRYEIQHSGPDFRYFVQEFLGLFGTCTDPTLTHRSNVTLFAGNDWWQGVTNRQDRRFAA
jgi:hypothetical protein